MVCELQRLHFSSPEGIRLARELWEILRHKKGCRLSRLYRAANDESLWLAYSEWESLGELAGARREAARSPLNRRLHSMLKASSERAYEPFGPVQSTHGINFAAGPAAMLINFLEEMDEPKPHSLFLPKRRGTFRISCCTKWASPSHWPASRISTPRVTPKSCG